MKVVSQKWFLFPDMWTWDVGRGSEKKTWNLNTYWLALFKPSNQQKLFKATYTQLHGPCSATRKQSIFPCCCSGGMFALTELTCLSVHENSGSLMLVTVESISLKIYNARAWMGHFSFDWPSEDSYSFWSQLWHGITFSSSFQAVMSWESWLYLLTK